MDRFKIKKCKVSGHEWKQYNSLQKCPCTECRKTQKVYVIPPVSEKRKKLLPSYEKVRIEVLTEAKFKCFIEGCRNVATTAEHTMGRKGFADDFARENNIPLLIDKRFLRACCLEHNLELENNPELSKKYQLSKISGKPKQ